MLDLGHPQFGMGTAVTLADVASKAGVATSTVSRALSNSPNGVSETVANKIKKIAADIGYVRDPTGSALRSRKSGMIGVLVPRLSDVVVATIYEGIDLEAAEAGYLTLVANSLDNLELQRQRVGELLQRRVEGLIIADARRDSSLVSDLGKSDVPFVLVSRGVRGFASITCDDYEGGVLAAEHLLELGHRTLGIAAGQAYAQTGVNRTRGFIDRCASAGVTIDPDLVINSTFAVEGGRSTAEELFRRNGSITAIFATNDNSAIGAMRVIQQRGMRIGEDVAVLGFNDIPIAAELPIPLSSVSSPMELMGRRAAKAMISRLTGGHPRSVKLAPELRVRESTLLSRH